MTISAFASKGGWVATLASMLPASLGSKTAGAARVVERTSSCRMTRCHRLAISSRRPRPGSGSVRRRDVIFGQLDWYRSLCDADPIRLAFTFADQYDREHDMPEIHDMHEILERVNR